MTKTKTSLTLIALLVAAAPSLAMAGAGDIFHGAPRSGSVDIGGAFHSTENQGNKFDPIFNPKPEADLHIDKGLEYFKTRNGNGPVVQQPASGPVNPQAIGLASVASKLDLSKVLKCVVAGTPSEFPDDLQIVNIGLAPIAAGTRLGWTIAAPKAAGKFVLDRTIAPGEGFRLQHAIPGGAEAGTVCKVTVAK